MLSSISWNCLVCFPVSTLNFIFLKKFLIFFPQSIHSEKTSYIFSKESFSYISVYEALHISSQAQKKKIHPEKNSLHFRKLELLALILKYFKERKPWNLEWMELFSFNITQFQEKIIYISGNGNPKRAF